MADFNLAIIPTLQHEGGFQNKPNDSGNWTGGRVGVGELKGTNMGISAAQFPLLDIPNLTAEDVKPIYRLHYWNDIYDQIHDQYIANKLFDLGVLFGQGTAVEFLQKALSHTFSLVVDGKMGQTTLTMTNDAEPVSLLVAYKTLFVARAIGIGTGDANKRPDVGGWIRRINS
jgi:lysozyme family protein